LLVSHKGIWRIGENGLQVDKDLQIGNGPASIADQGWVWYGARVTDKAKGGGGSALSGLTDKIPFLGGDDDDDEEGGGKKSKGATGFGRGRRLPVQEWVDVAVSIDKVYDQFTQFEDFPNFMHRVEKIEQRDETTLMWHENIWGIRRSWEATITDQEPCERIAWRSDSVETVGVVTFHKLAENLTRVYMTVDFQPKGFLEKSASGLRLSRRAIKSDLMRFKAFIEMKDEPTGAWGGTIEDGEVVSSEGDDREERGEDEGEDTEARGSDDEERESEEDEESDEEEPVAESEEDEESEEEEEDEPVAESDEDEESEEDEDEDEPVAESEEDEEEEQQPRRRRKGRFARDSEAESESDEEDEDEDDEPVAESESDEEEEVEEERPRPKRRPRAKAKAKAK